MQFFSLTESLLMEAVALTKGSQRVMNDKNLVANLADSIRDDARSHPAAFPPGSSRTFQKAPDEQLAQWFLENIDKIEKEGYEGTVYSRDGVNSEWIVRRYIAGSHNWEDLTGVMNMNLRDWYLLKNRNMLDANHKDLPKFNSVRDVGYYMTTHYKDKLDTVRDAAKNAARNKMAKSVKLIDNEDYRVYTTLNRAAGCLLGLGTQWCTANSNYGGHFHSYAGKNMLFQLFPYAKEKDEKGNVEVKKDEDGKKILDPNEKYQFDAGGSFMDVTDTPAGAKKIAAKFPYLYTDLAKALKDNKSKMEQAFKELSDDPTLQGEDYKIKTYEIDDEIKKLHKFVDKGYFTDQVRPKSVSSAETPAAEKPQELGQEQPQGQQVMENVDKDVAAMLSSLKKYDKLVESVAPVLGMVTLGEKDEGKHNNGKTTGFKAVAKKAAEEYGSKEAGERVAGAVRNKMKAAGKLEEGDDSDDKNPWEKLASDKKDDSDEGKETKTHKGATVTKTKTGVIHKKADESVEISEGADEDVLAWMSRFSKLGNMKGYGR